LNRDAVPALMEQMCRSHDAEAVPWFCVLSGGHHVIAVICYNTGCSKNSFTTVFQMLLCVSVTKTFTLKGAQTIHRSTHSNIWNTIVELFFKHPALPVKAVLNLTIPGKTRSVLLHYDCLKHCSCPLN
jgi:hypothetical protein